MSNPALWTIYATARYQEKLEEAEKARQAQAFQTAASRRGKLFGHSREIYWLRPHFRPRMAK